MIPSLTEVLFGCEFLARRLDWELSPRNARLNESIAERHAEAVKLGATPEEEPAALFYAFCRDAYLFGDDYLALPMTMTINHAHKLGWRLRATRFERIEQARAISEGLVTYPEIRAWFAARLTPLEPTR